MMLTSILISSTNFLMMVVVGGAQEGSAGIGTVISDQVVLEIMIYYYGSTRKNILFNRKKEWFYCFSQTGGPDKHLKVF